MAGLREIRGIRDRNTLQLNFVEFVIMSPTFVTEEEEARYAELQGMALDYARWGETGVLQKMVEAGMPVNLADHRGNTLLMLAAYHGHGDTVHMLIDHGAEVDRRNDRGQTPLGGVAFKGKLALVRLLVEAGAEVDADNGGGRTPLMFAAMFGHRQVVDYLIDAGADAEAQSFLGLSALRLAKFTGAARSILDRLRSARARSH